MKSPSVKEAFQNQLIKKHPAFRYKRLIVMLLLQREYLKRRKASSIKEAFHNQLIKKHQC
jgi:hypothetical protein